MELFETIAYMIVRDNKVLAEKRKMAKKVRPGIISIPGGHVDEGESIEGALRRELNEELGVVVKDFRYVCALLDQAEEFRKLNYFWVKSWQGEIQNNEAEELVWVSLDETNRLDLHTAKLAISEYLRLYKN